MYFDLDVIDFTHYEQYDYLRVRNYKDENIKIQSMYMITRNLIMELKDEDLYIHCLEKQETQFKETGSLNYIFSHRKI